MTISRTTRKLSVFHHEVLRVASDFVLPFVLRWLVFLHDPKVCDPPEFFEPGTLQRSRLRQVALLKRV
jgi:hypothetical protein